jgi:hypothetical protein
MSDYAVVSSYDRLPKRATGVLILDTALGTADPDPAFLEKLAVLHATKVSVYRPMTPALLAAISRMPALTSLYVSSHWGHELRLDAAPLLKSLSARTIADVGHLGALPALEYLSLDYGDSDEPLDLEPLVALRRLNHFGFSGRLKGLESLSKLPALQTLRLSLRGEELRTDPADHIDLGPLAALRGLTSLSVSGFRSRALTLFARLSRLEKLSLDWSAPHGHVSEPCVDAASLGGLCAIKTLALKGPLGFDDTVAMLVALEKNAQPTTTVSLDCGLPKLLEKRFVVKTAASLARIALALKDSAFPRIAPAPAAPPEPKALKKSLAPVREAMKGAEDPRAIVVALRSLDRAALEVVAAGTGLSADATLVFGPYLEKECKSKDRADVALYLLDMVGLLDGVQALDLSDHKALMDLGALERHLGTLEVLMLNGCPRLAKIWAGDEVDSQRPAFVGADAVKAAVNEALQLRTPFDWPQAEVEGPDIPPALVALFDPPEPEGVMQAVSLAASLGLARRLLADCTPDPSWDLGIRRGGLLRHKCPDCGGTGHVRARKVAQSTRLETQCPTCAGLGEPQKAAETLTLGLLALLATLPDGDPAATRLVGGLTEVRSRRLTQLAWLKHARQLTTLEAPWRLCEPALALLQGLPALSRLELSELPEDLSPVARFTHLNTLVLSGGGTVDARCLEGLDALETLIRGGVTLTHPQSLAALPRLKTLR